jgi:hypothetical protein
MIKKIINFIKNMFTCERQDPHLEMYENVRLDKKEKIKRKYKDILE